MAAIGSPFDGGSNDDQFFTHAPGAAQQHGARPPPQHAMDSGHSGPGTGGHSGGPGTGGPGPGPGPGAGVQQERVVWTRYVKIRGISYSCAEEDVRAFISEFALDPTLGDKAFLHITLGGQRGEAYAVFKDHVVAERALWHLHKENLGDRYVELYESSEGDMEAARQRQEAIRVNTNPIIRIRGLPYTTTRHEVRAFFSIVTDEELLDFTLCTTVDGRLTGDAFMEFTTVEARDRAASRSGGTIGPRYVEVLESNAHERDVISHAARNKSRRLQQQMRNNNNNNNNNNSMMNGGGRGGGYMPNMAAGPMMMGGRGSFGGGVGGGGAGAGGGGGGRGRGGGIGVPPCNGWGPGDMGMNPMHYPMMHPMFNPVMAQQMMMMMMGGGAGGMQMPGVTMPHLQHQHQQQHQQHQHQHQHQHQQLQQQQQLDHHQSRPPPRRSPAPPGANNGVNGGPARMGGGGGGRGVVRVKGLPYSASADGVAEFLSGVSIAAQGVHLVFGDDERPTGEAFVEVTGREDVEAALRHNKGMLGNQLVEVFRSSRNEMSLREPEHSDPQ